jgi:hypothetical protein
VERVGVHLADVAVDAANRQIHLAQPPRRGVRLLPVDRQIADAAIMRQHKPLALHEHPARPAARIVYTAFVRLDHLDQQLHHRLRRVELAAALALRAGEPAEEVLVHAAQHTLQRRVLFLDRDHGFVDQLTDGGLLGVRLQVGPTRLLGHPENILSRILIAHVVIALGIGCFLQQIDVALFKRIGDVLQEDQTEDDVLVFGGGLQFSSKPRGAPLVAFFWELVFAVVLRLVFVSSKSALGYTDMEARHELAQWLGYNPHRTEVTYAYVPKSPQG